MDQRCDELIVYESEEDAIVLSEILRQQKGKLPILILGGGSNLLLTEDFHGMVVTPGKRFSVDCKDGSSDKSEVILNAWAGTNFDEMVAFAVKQEYFGLENLSLIPGECGASAVQNIGAYGVEVKDLILEINAIEIATGKQVTIKAEDCHYGYRSSKFKKEWKDQYLITNVIYKLHKQFTPHLDYGNLHKVLSEKNIAPAQLTGELLRELIIEIRQAKLPDPEDLGNAGSFFTNPIVDEATLNKVRQQHPNVHYFEVQEPATDVSSDEAERKSTTRYKIPAGWMIDQCGWKGRSLGRAGVYDKQALVLVNLGGATGADVVTLMKAIQENVYQEFGIHIYPEVNII